MEQIKREIAELNNNIKNLDYATLMYMSLNAKNLGLKALMEKKDERTAYIQLMHFVNIFAQLQTHEGYIENKGFYETLISPNTVIKIMRCCEKLYDRLWTDSEVEKLTAAEKEKLNIEINKQYDNYNRSRSNTIKQFLKEVKSPKPQPQVLQPLQPSKRYNENILNAPQRKSHAPIFDPTMKRHLPTCRFYNDPNNQNASNDAASNRSSVQVSRTDANPNENRENENVRRQAQQNVPKKLVRFSENNDNQQNNNVARALHQPINLPLMCSTPRKNQNDADSSIVSHGFMNYAFIAERSEDTLFRQVQHNPTIPIIPTSQIRRGRTNIRIDISLPKQTNESVQVQRVANSPPPQVTNEFIWPEVYNGNYMKNN